MIGGRAAKAALDEALGVLDGFGVVAVGVDPRRIADVHGELGARFERPRGGLFTLGRPVARHAAQALRRCRAISS